MKTLECAPWNLAGWWPLLIFLIGIFSYYAMAGLNIHPLDHSVFDRFISFPMPSAFQLLAFVSGFFIYLFSRRNCSALCYIVHFAGFCSVCTGILVAILTLGCDWTRMGG
jgi:hypothetical protein